MSIANVVQEKDIILVINIISLARLIDGGAAMLNAENKNQNIVSAGKKFSSPFVKYNLRVFEVE